MENRPTGRQVHNLGGSGTVNKRGSGLGSGPVGSKNGYSGRNGGSSGGNRGNRGRRGGISGIGIAIVVIILAIKLFGGGWNIGGLTDTVSSLGDVAGYTSGSSLLTVMNLVSNVEYVTSETDYSSYASTSSGNYTADTTVAEGSRAKRTVIKGDGTDNVTIMVYMCGTDLESKNGMASADLKEMCNATLSDNVNIIVYTGGCTAWKTSGISNKVNQIYKIENSSLVCLEEDMGNHSMTDPATLTEFINYCTKNYPANRQDLILWDHGGGSISGFGYDEKSKSGSMTLSGINKALKNAGTTFDFIGFDACLMATVENGLMLANYADYMIASEETEPGVGWYYTNWLTKLSKNTSIATVETGKNIVDDFIDVCNQKCSGQKTTLSVVDLAELSNTVPSELKAFAESTNSMIQNDNYKVVSQARVNTKEFAQSSKIDQIDLVDFANRLGTKEGKALANALESSVKYNRTASCVKDAHGLSIYFPYKKASKINQVVNTYNDIGMDSEYSECIKEFASLETCGQISGGGTQNAYTTLSGGNYSSSTTTSSAISSLLGSIISGDSTSSTVSGFDLSSLSSLLSGSSYGADKAAVYIENNRFDTDALIWTKNANDEYVIVLSEEQWSLVNELDINIFVDDGTGYIDLGLDFRPTYDEDGNLMGITNETWMSINGQIVPYYYIGEDNGIYSGYVPVFLNGVQAELIISSDAEHDYIVGARYTYEEKENDTVAKDLIALVPGDTLDFVCDYYDYNGNYKDSYYLGEQMVLGDTVQIGNIAISGKTVITYRFTDIYNQEYWTPVLP